MYFFLFETGFRKTSNREGLVKRSVHVNQNYDSHERRCCSINRRASRSSAESLSDGGYMSAQWAVPERGESRTESSETVSVFAGSIYLPYRTHQIRQMPAIKLRVINLTEWWEATAPSTRNTPGNRLVFVLSVFTRCGHISVAFLS